MSDLDHLFEQARAADPTDRIEFRAPIAEHGGTAIPTLESWLDDIRLCRFAIGTLERIADTPAHRWDVLAILDSADTDSLPADLQRNVAEAAGRVRTLIENDARRARGPADGRAPTPLEQRFHADMEGVYRRAGEATRHQRPDGTFERGYWATYFLRGVRNHGGLQYAKQLLRQSGTTDGFKRLADEHHLDLTMEALIVREEYADLFTDEERAIASSRLAAAGYRPGRR